MAGEFYFEPTLLRVAAAEVEVSVVNEGNALHNVSLETQGVGEDVAAGDAATGVLAFPAPGSLTFEWKYHLPHAMRGEL